MSDAKTEFNKRKLASRTEPSFFAFVPAVAVAVPFSFSPSETPSSPSTTPASVSDAGTSPSTTARAPAAIADASAATVSAPAGAFWSRRAATSSCASSEAARYARAARDVSPGIEETERNVSATRATRVAAETFSCSFSRVLFFFVRVGTASDGTLPESSLESFASSLEWPTCGNVRSPSSATRTHTTPPSSTESVVSFPQKETTSTEAPGHDARADAPSAERSATPSHKEASSSSSSHASSSSSSPSSSPSSSSSSWSSICSAPRTISLSTEARAPKARRARRPHEKRMSAVTAAAFGATRSSTERTAMTSVKGSRLIEVPAKPVSVVESRRAATNAGAAATASASSSSMSTSTSRKWPSAMSASRSRARSRGVTTAPARARRSERSSASDAPGSGLEGRPSMRTARGMTAGGGAVSAETPARAAAIAAGARSAHSSSTTASGRRRRISARMSRAASSTSTCDTPTRCNVAPPGPSSRRTTRVASETRASASAVTTRRAVRSHARHPAPRRGRSAAVARACPRHAADATVIAREAPCGARARVSPEERDDNRCQRATHPPFR